MWICLNNGFFSVVAPADDLNGEYLIVRARRQGDIERYFPGVKVERRPERDYLFRATVAREEVSAVIAAEIAGLDYNNFKNSVRDDRLHGAYSRVWGTMASLQPTPPYSGTRKSTPAARQRRRSGPSTQLSLDKAAE